ncbi:preprotein translocase subunit YajC [Cytobacillus horneckiae]|uniref:DUF4083 family protein n=1 Tax=Cytobacillus horneckiae TaxID=549687 RepID=UPI0019D0DA88|nr:DUF4083 family protein [Cytobacillus horneckiae]MBN6886984.1 DUF4083 family protein [Cytobacillus horneckiae]
MLNIGDIIFQLLSLVILVGVINFFVSMIRTQKRSRRSNQSLDKKLDKIIDLLEEQQKR